ncbi:hypothetical protein OAO01_04010 [Oligoflexia bacterium]|nr:hypothetical protein [Oligoflexia bacterium]
MRIFLITLFLVTGLTTAQAEDPDFGFTKTSLGYKVQKYITTRNLIDTKSDKGYYKDKILIQANPVSSYVAETRNLVKYGYDFYLNETKSDNGTNLRLRGGVSKASKKAAAGVQLIVSW